MEGFGLSATDAALVAHLLRQSGIPRTVCVFGSRVKGTARLYSDLDLVVMGDEPLPIDQVVALREAFSESDLSIKVDLVEWASLSLPFRQRIADSLIPLFVA